MKKKQQKPESRGGDLYLAEGQSAIEEYAKHRPEAVKELQYKPAAEKLARRLAAEHNWPLSVQKPSGEGPSAPIAAWVRVPTRSEDELMPRLASRAQGMLLALDHINDPRNLGAIVRTAAFFGVHEIIAPKDRQVRITQSSVATAQGGFAISDLFCVTNLVRSLEKLKKEGYWIIGSKLGAPALNSSRPRYEKMVLVLGSEENGISRLVEEACDLLVSIPGTPGGLDSLNVSVATGILIHGLQS